MKNTFGNSVAVTIIGESHGAYIGAVLDGMAPGINVSDDEIEAALTKRRPYGKISTSRTEADKYQIISGVFNGKTTGTPITIIIPNENTKSKDYNYGVARPSHADYTAYCKYHGFEDYRGGGHFSGRITAALVAVGAITQSALNAKGIKLGTHIKTLAGINDMPFSDMEKDIDLLNSKIFSVISEEAGEKMRSAAEEIAKEGDSVGGILETAIIGMPAGVGEPFFDSVESRISHAIFSVPGVKGVLFGAGENFAKIKGSVANDGFFVDNGRIKTYTNNNGGINGGITNGEPIVFSTIVKPTPSIYKEQKTVNFIENENALLSISGRHDPCIVHRVRAVVDSITAITICDLLAERYGTDYLMQEE